jgi:hypothetical protein
VSLPRQFIRWSKGQGSPIIEKQQIIAELRWIAERLSDFYEPDEARFGCKQDTPNLTERSLTILLMAIVP